MPSWIGPWEIAIVLVVALLVFGPKKLPDLGSSLGRSINGFKKGLKETKDDVQAAIKEDVSVETAAPARTEVQAEAPAAVVTPAAPAASAAPAAPVAEAAPIAQATAAPVEKPEL